MSPARVALALLLVTGFIGASQGQGFKSPAPSGPMVITILPGIDDPGVVADLKLSQEQVRALVARRQALWDEAYATAPDALVLRANVRLEETDAVLKKTLTAAQYKRAEQLVAQQIIKNAQGFPKTGESGLTAQLFRRYPELITAFKLTDEQKKMVTAKFFGVKSLNITPAQTAAAGEFYGPSLAKGWTPKNDPRLSGSRPKMPRELGLLDAAAVRDDLSVTDEQAKPLAALRAKWKALDGDVSTPFSRRTDMSPKEIDEQAGALWVETEKLIAGTLAPNQLVRLRQIAFQDAHRGTHIEQLYTIPEVATTLALSEQQVKDLDGTREAFNKDAVQVFEALESYEATAKRVKELAAARRDKSAAILTPEQTSKLKSLMGESFTGSVISDSSRSSRDLNLSVLSRAANFGMYGAEFTHLATSKSIQEELKLTAEQINRCYQVRDEVQSKFPVGSRAVEKTKQNVDRSKFVEAELGKILTAEQAVRFRQIMMQACEQQTNDRGATVGLAVAYPGVAEAVKLTDEQRKSILGGVSARGILSTEQIRAIEKMMGEPFRGELAPPPKTAALPAPQPKEPNSVSPVFFLFSGMTTPSLEVELKLTPDQLNRLEAARTDYRVAIQPETGMKFGSAGTKLKVAELAKFEKTVAGILTPEQTKRLREVLVQFGVVRNLHAALTAPETAKSLGLTAEQTEKLTALAAEAEQLQRLRFSERVTDPDQKFSTRLRDAANARMLATLTAEQRARWQEMAGEPWEGLRTLRFIPK